MASRFTGKVLQLSLLAITGRQDSDPCYEVGTQDDRKRPASTKRSWGLFAYFRTDSDVRSTYPNS